MSKALELADAYADACFDQALNQRTEDPIPEQKRDALAAELRRLAEVEAERDALKAELERIRALEPVPGVALTDRGVALVRHGDESCFGRRLYTLEKP